MKQVIFCGLMICLFSTCANAVSYDGKWWNDLPRDERLAFTAGYFDCAVYDAGQDNMGDISWYQIESEVTRFYNENTPELEKTVIVVIRQLYATGKLKHRKPDYTGEYYPEKHGIFDGEYWRQLHFENVLLRFIEGYLVCQREFKKPEASFSREAKWYVKQISEWYGVRSDDPGKINEERYQDKIADVLYRLKD